MKALCVAPVLLALVFTATTAVGRQEAPPRGRDLAATSLSRIDLLELTPSDRHALRAADDRLGKPGPLRIAEPRAVSIRPATHGTWTALADGARLWQLRVHVPGATDLNFGFTEYRLPAGATLHVWSEAEGYYEGPYTPRDHRTHRQLWTPMVPGDRAVIEVYLPAGADGPDLELTRINVGYRDAFGDLARAPGSCNVDVACGEADDWRQQVQGVARYTVSGLFLCSGSLINDARSSRRPFFLTAFHCGVDRSNDQTVVVYWNFESPRCGQLGGGSLADNQTGASFVAGDLLLDGLLLELDAPPSNTSGAFFNGWDRSGAQPRGAVGIHHPLGDEKAISFDDDPLDRCTPDLPDHWMTSWDLGTTEPGSSGSPIFDPDTQRIVGFLTGGDASCDRPQGIDCYGPTAEFLRLPAVRRALGAKRNRPQAVDGLDSTCDCSAPGAVVGTSGNDRLTGTAGDDILCGLEGDDLLLGKGGRDCLEGGEGDDRLKGGRGGDALHGGAGEDSCNGGPGNDSAGGCEGTKRVP